MSKTPEKNSKQALGSAGDNFLALNIKPRGLNKLCPSIRKPDWFERHTFSPLLSSKEGLLRILITLFIHKGFADKN
jgi:hypothetical protein